MRSPWGVSRGESGELDLRWLAARDQRRPQISHSIEVIGTDACEQSIGATDCFLHENIVMQHLGRLKVIAERVPPGRSCPNVRDQCIDSMVGDAKCRGWPLGHE
jgi:hypothetical protein